MLRNPICYVIFQGGVVRTPYPPLDPPMFYLEGLVRGLNFGLSLHLHTLCVQAAVLARLCMCADSNSTEASLLGDSISTKISYADSIISLFPSCMFRGHLQCGTISIRFL